MKGHRRELTLIWFLMHSSYSQLQISSSDLIWPAPVLQLLQGNSSEARPGVLGRGHCLRHLWGGGQIAQQRVEDSVDGRWLEVSADEARTSASCCAHLNTSILFHPNSLSWWHCCCYVKYIVCRTYPKHGDKVGEGQSIWLHQAAQFRFFCLPSLKWSSRNLEEIDKWNGVILCAWQNTVSWV